MTDVRQPQYDGSTGISECLVEKYLLELTYIRGFITKELGETFDSAVYKARAVSVSETCVCKSSS